MTTRTEEARGLLAIALDEGRAAPERQAAYLEANSIRKELKVGWPKLHPRGLPLDSASLENELQRLVDKVAADLAHIGEEPLGPTDAQIDDLVATSGLPEHVVRKAVGEGQMTTAPEAPRRLKTAEEALAEGIKVTVVTPEGESTSVVGGPPAAPAAPKARPRKASTPKDEHRGEISALVRSLLQSTDLPYADIVARVLVAHPTARTTARSVASVAADLRKAGGTVSLRRPEAKR